MPSKKVTPRACFLDGELLESWPCDYNPATKETESNGGVEALIFYKAHYYTVILHDGQAYELNKVDLDATEDVPEFIQKAVTQHLKTQGAVEI